MTRQPLYAITRRDAQTTHIEQVRAFLAGGARLIQIRDKAASGRDLYDITVAALDIARPFGAQIVVNDRVDVARAADADGVHVGQDDLPALAARAILGPGKIVGLSTHNRAQLVEALGLELDYIAIGPVFGTKTKENPDPVVGLDGVRMARQMVGETALVAIGGITLETAPAVLAAGATSVAVVGDLAVAGDLSSRVAAYLATLGG